MNFNLARLRSASLILFLACGSLSLSPVLADSVGLAWQPSPSPAVTGYYIYYGVSGSFTNRVDAGNQTSTLIGGLQPGMTYFFYGTAYDSAGDESGPSSTVTFHVNTPPVANGLTVQTAQNQSIGITLSGTDADSDPLIFQVIAGPSHGTLNGITPSLTYTPALNYAGADSFTFKANDAKADSAPATVSIAVIVPPDTAPPVVAVIAPSSGSKVSGNVSVSVSASDNVGVTGVNLYLGNVRIGSSTTVPALFTWDTTRVANGSYSLMASASDAAGNSAMSSSISVTVQNPVPDTTPPSVDVLSPTTGTAVSGTTQIQVTASDNVAVTKIQCYVNSTLIGSAIASPATFSWDTTTSTNGIYTLQATAYDSSGNSATASEPSITVSNQAADKTAPTVKITSPKNGTTVTKNFQTQVAASDNVRVTSVQLYLDAKLIGTSTSSNPSFTINSTKLAKGSHSLVAKAFDAANNQSSSAAVTVYK